jgi:hypothetical protein
MEIDISKACLEQIVLEGGKILWPLVTKKVVEDMLEKSIQDEEQSQWIVDMYKALAQVVAYNGVR